MPTHWYIWGSPGGPVVKNLPANAWDARDMDLIPGSERYPGEGSGNPLQYSRLENPMDRGVWWATVHVVTKSWTQLSDWTYTRTQTHTHRGICPLDLSHIYCNCILLFLSFSFFSPHFNQFYLCSSLVLRIFTFSSVQSLSRVQLFATPWIAAHQASLSITNSWSSLRLTSIESVMLSSHLILCSPLLLLPPIPPSIRVFSNESTLRMRWPKYWGFSFSIIPSKEIPGLISFRMDWLDLLAVHGTLKSLLQHHTSKASILCHSAFFTI